MTNEISELVVSVEKLLKLIDDNDLVRDISRDSDFGFFVKQGVRINNTLVRVQQNLKVVKKL